MNELLSPDEPKVSEWIAQNAFVTWLETREPWKVEEAMIRAISLPLNLDQNRNHPFHGGPARAAVIAARALSPTEHRVTDDLEPRDGSRATMTRQMCGLAAEAREGYRAARKEEPHAGVRTDD